MISKAITILASLLLVLSTFLLSEMHNRLNRMDESLAIQRALSQFCESSVAGLQDSLQTEIQEVRRRVEDIEMINEYTRRAR